MLWALVIGMGRTVGFTTTGAAAKQSAPPAGVNFDDFLNPSSAPGASSGPPASRAGG